MGVAGPQTFFLLALVNFHPQKYVELIYELSLTLKHVKRIYCVCNLFPAKSMQIIDISVIGGCHFEFFK